ncbi:hypothetical protein H310_11472 [Aphanomyces invadans]|uniref:Peptidase A2 domain-containing protein n=1 Tax=Aphanomyces invadans TaxID=157072 RepID=A0A024TL84_9STRA|nr:hypothetical protein H310_11472 [Aphanomyces invadans]ETV94798.1 hypothetical protein H310_11472 [Aphanomyces invadans]|eukprot:XP_008876389.1 hypothetical protein H310_11472 [Aphanomyces invadans]
MLFNDASQEEPRDLRRLESAIKFDVKIVDAESRVGKMLDGISLEGGQSLGAADGCEQADAATTEQAYTDGCFPFCALATDVRSRLPMYGGVEDEEKPAKPTLKCGESRNSESKKQEPPKKKDSTGKGFGKPSGVTSTDAVSDCPKAASDEAEGLIQAQIKGRKEARDKRATANMIDLSRERTKIEGRAVVCEVVPVDQLLLDTGASVNVVSAELFSALKKAKADVQVVQAATNECGARDDVWAPATARHASLGFSMDTLLVQARAKKPERDLSDSSFLPMTVDATVHHVQAVRPIVEDYDPDGWMECATPKLDIRDGEDNEESRQRQQAELEAVLAIKVDEAKSQGLSPAGVTKLEILVAIQPVDPLLRLLEVGTTLPKNAKKPALIKLPADKTVCLFIDTSDGFWEAIATQVPPEELNQIVEQRQSRWRSLAARLWGKLELAHCGEGDHRNLVHIFNPMGQSPNTAKYQADKLQHWDLVMSTFSYMNESVSGENNAWEDLLSRWGSVPAFREFATVSTLKVQTEYLATGQAPGGVKWNKKTKFHVTSDDKTWRPDEAVDLQQRLCVFAHQGADDTAA